MKQYPIIIVVANLALAGIVNAQSTLSGSISADNLDENGSFTSSSLTMDGPNLIVDTEGDFSTLVPTLSDLTAYNLTISGLSSSPTSVSINNFVVFSSPDANTDASGTTPVNRFEFDLTSITEDFPDSYFSGTGTLVDTSSVSPFANTPATFSLSFSDPTDYSFTVEAVPEPTTIGLFAAGLLGVLAFRRRKV